MLLGIAGRNFLWAECCSFLLEHMLRSLLHHYCFGCIFKTVIWHRSSDLQLGMVDLFCLSWLACDHCRLMLQSLKWELEDVMTVRILSGNSLHVIINTLCTFSGSEWWHVQLCVEKLLTYLLTWHSRFIDAAVVVDEEICCCQLSGCLWSHKPRHWSYQRPWHHHREHRVAQSRHI